LKCDVRMTCWLARVANVAKTAKTGFVVKNFPKTVMPFLFLSYWSYKTFNNQFMNSWLFAFAYTIQQQLTLQRTSSHHSALYWFPISVCSSLCPSLSLTNAGIMSKHIHISSQYLTICYRHRSIFFSPTAVTKFQREPSQWRRWKNFAIFDQSCHLFCKQHEPLTITIGQ